MSKSKIYAPYWKIKFKGIATVKPIKGCMQDPIPPIKGSDEKPDWRFEGIVDPDIGKLSSLCSSVKRTPELGSCNKTTQGFSGRMIMSSEIGSEVYEWSAKKVPCKCSAKITYYKGDIKINGNPILGKGGINLSDTIVETGIKSTVEIKFGNAIIRVGPKSHIDLTDICKKEDEDKESPVLKVIKGSIRAILIKPFEGKSYRVNTSTAVIGVRGTDFILISEDDKTVVMVLDGEVSFWDINKRKTVTVKKNQKSECVKAGIPANPVFFNPQEIPEWFR